MGAPCPYKLWSMDSILVVTLNVLEAIDVQVPEVCFLEDSTCTLDSMMEGFVTRDLYTINRISEIRKSANKMNCEVKSTIASHLRRTSLTREPKKIVTLGIYHLQSGRLGEQSSNFSDEYQWTRGKQCLL